MQLNDAHIIITGAGGGIGSKTALALAQKGAGLVLVDRDAAALGQLCNEIRKQGGEAIIAAGDLTRAEDRQQVVDKAHGHFGDVDALINLAGLLNFNPFEAEDPLAMEKLLQVNVMAPILLTRKLLPHMLERKRGRIVNIGSTFGSIGFAYFATYSASKFALRGFSEALRRELAGTGVGVTYIAPRATRTPLNTSAVYRMNEALKISMDPPEVVAAAIVQAIERDSSDVYLGWPEKLFVRLNAILPRLVDAALRKQNRRMRKFSLEP